MASQTIVSEPPRKLPRVLAWFLLLLAAVVGIVGGIVVGQTELATKFILVPGMNGPIENCVMFFIALGIAAFVIFAKWYESRGINVTLGGVAAIAFGALPPLLGGFYGLLAVCALGGVIYVIALARKKAI